MSVLRFFMMLVVATAGSQVNAGIVNGDFAAAKPLADFTVTLNIVGEPTDAFAQFSDSGALEQTFDIPNAPSTLSFDFAFSTTSSATSPPSLPDSFSVSVLTANNLDFLDILVVDIVQEALTDPSEGLPGVTPIDASLDTSFFIFGFVGLKNGTDFSGRVSLLLPSNVLGEKATIFFDLFDFDGFETIAAVDNITLTSSPIVPEPASLAIWGVILGGTLMRRRRRQAVRV